VDEQYDTGPIVAQGVVPCHPDDNADMLGARVLRLEHELYPATVAALCDDRIAWRDDGIPFVWQKA
jgi:phosphoribosylglycinamide formyltransferase